MKIKNLVKLNISVIIPVLILFSCSGSNFVPNNIEYQEIAAASCVNNPNHNYHFSQPVSIQSGEKYPLILVFDAHGDGNLATQKIVEASNLVPCIIVGDDAVENGHPDFMRLIGEILNEAVTRFPVDTSQIILAGFSGGARMASYFALIQEVKGVLMLAAGPGNEIPKSPLFTISGTQDFNFFENYSRPEMAALDQLTFTADYFPGKHDWPSPASISDALLLLLMNEDLSELGEYRSEALLEEAKKLNENGQAMDSWKALEKASKLTTSSSIKENVKELAQEILKSKALQDQIELLEKNLSDEDKVRKIYVRKTTESNLEWWTNEITALRKNIDQSKNDLQKDHFKRLEAFIGILFFSRANQWIQTEPENKYIPTLLDAFEFLEPENPDVYDLKSKYAIILEDSVSSVKFIAKSKELTKKK